VTDIPYARQDISEADIAAVVAALREPLLTQGPLAERFESEFAETVGARYAVAFNSGTARARLAKIEGSQHRADLRDGEPVGIGITAV
jgi:dTDP-4-amino-4,6-dideoxygalactose transaminase